MMEKVLDNGWTIASFTSVLDIEGGTQPPKEKFIYSPKEGYIRLLQIRDFGDKPVPTFVPITNNLKTCKKSDILIARYGASIGRILTNQDGAYNVALAKVTIPALLDRKYIYWYLKSPKLQNRLTSFQRTAQNGFNKNDLADLTLPLPPLAEQKRIVAKLDMAFGYLETLKASLARIPELLKTFRQSVLTQAVTGKLTEDWRGSNPNLCNLIAVEENNPFEQELPKGWSWDYCKNLGEHKLGKMLDAAKNTGEHCYYLRNVNVRWFWFDLEDLAQMKISEQEKGKFDVRNGDIFICEGGEPGRAAVWQGGDNQLIFQKALHRIRVNQDVEPFWFLFNLKALADNGTLRGYFTGTGIMHLTLKSLSTLPLPLPSLSEQQEIVSRVEALFAKADAIEAQYLSLKEKIDKLPQALLAKAFRGELVPQDPADEPASVLLEKIQKEMGKLGKKGKKQKEPALV